MKTYHFISLFIVCLAPLTNLYAYDFPVEKPDAYVHDLDETLGTITYVEGDEEAIRSQISLQTEEAKQKGLVLKYWKNSDGVEDVLIYPKDIYSYFKVLFESTEAVFPFTSADSPENTKLKLQLITDPITGQSLFDLLGDRAIIVLHKDFHAEDLYAHANAVEKKAIENSLRFYPPETIKLIDELGIRSVYGGNMKRSLNSQGQEVGEWVRRPWPLKTYHKLKQLFNILVVVDDSIDVINPNDLAFHRFPNWYFRLSGVKPAHSRRMTLTPEGAEKLIRTRSRSAYAGACSSFVK